MTPEFQQKLDEMIALMAKVPGHEALQVYNVLRMCRAALQTMTLQIETQAQQIIELRKKHLPSE